MTVQVASSAGPMTVPVSLQTGAPAASPTTTDSADVPKSIPDDNAAGVTSNLVLGAGRVADLDARINSLTHPYVSDLEIDLESPAGTVVRLFNRHGGSADNFTGTVFDDEAATAIAAGAAPFTGSFRPHQPLSAFDGQSTAGTWRLTVRDRSLADIGTVNGWGVRRTLYDCS